MPGKSGELRNLAFNKFWHLEGILTSKIKKYIKKWRELKQYWREFWLGSWEKEQFFFQPCLWGRYILIEFYSQFPCKLQMETTISTPSKFLFKTALVLRNIILLLDVFSWMLFMAACLLLSRIFISFDFKSLLIRNTEYKSNYFFHVTFFLQMFVTFHDHTYFQSY